MYISAKHQSYRQKWSFVLQLKLLVIKLFQKTNKKAGKICKTLA